MANHKRKRPKHQRGGCIFCKYYKDERAGTSERAKPSDRRRMQEAPRDERED